MVDFATLILGADTRGLKAGERDMDKLAQTGERTEKRVGKSARGMGKTIKANMTAVKVAVAGVTGALLALGGSMRLLADYDRQMSKVGAISRATADEMVKLRKVAADLGAATEFTAKQAGEGLEFLARAGFSASEAMQAIPAVLDLATASAMDLGQAADISSNIMSAFGIEAARSADVADVLAAATARANTDVGQLGDAMSYVGPVASALGISMNDAAAAIGVLSDAGIQGSSAGTGLRRVLSSLANPTGAAAKALKSLGVNLSDVNPATTELTDIVDILAKSGMDAAQALTIFGDRGGPAILALTSQAGRLRELTGELKDVGGEAKRMADEIRDNLGGDLDGLWSSLQSVILALGDAGLTYVLRLAVQGATALARTIGGLVSILGAVTGGLSSLAKWIFNAKSNQELLETATVKSTTAMSGNLTATEKLIGALKERRRVSIGVAQAELELLKISRDTIQAERDRMLAESGYLESVNAAQAAIQTQLDDVLSTERDIAEARRAGYDISEMMAPVLKYQDEMVVKALMDHRDIVKELEAQTFLSKEQKEILDQSNTAIEIYERAIGKASDGMVALQDATADAADETERVIAATARWEAMMVGVKAQVQAVASLISQLGGGLIDTAAKQAELSALRAGKSIQDAAVAAIEYKENLEVSAKKAELVARFGQTIGGAMGAALEKQVEFNRGLDQSLEAERGLTVERERQAALEARGGRKGGAGEAGKAASEAARDLQALADEIQRLEFDADPIKAYNHELMNLDKLRSSGLSEGAFQHALDKAKETLDATRTSFDGFKSSASSAFESLITGANSFEEALAGVLRSLASVFAQSASSGLFGSLSGALAGAFGGGGASASFAGIGTGGLYANGGVFSQGAEVTAFANGGVVNRATTFPMTGGTGLMGEAGPEAIMPLTRGRNGKLGVQAEGGGGVQRIELHVTADEGVTVEQVGKISRDVAVQVTRKGISANNRAQSDTRYLRGGQ